MYFEKLKPQALTLKNAYEPQKERHKSLTEKQILEKAVRNVIHSPCLILRLFFIPQSWYEHRSGTAIFLVFFPELLFHFLVFFLSKIVVQYN